MAVLVPIVGAAFPNRDGRNRRIEIACCAPGEPVRLAPEPENRADRNAIAVYSVRGVQIGYVRARLTARVSRHLALGGDPVAVFVRRSLAGAEAAMDLLREGDVEPSWIGLYG